VSEAVAGKTEAGITYAALYETLARAHRCEMAWVMDLASYKQIRRVSAANGGDDGPDEGKWVPSVDDRLLALRILVRDGGGEPHIEWLTREEMGL
jgi:hypothetical protein